MASDLQADKNIASETITWFHRWTASLYSFRTTRPAGYSFVAGQYARLGMETPDGVVWRAFSLTSAEGDDYLEFLVVDVPGGAFTSRLTVCRPGDKILVTRQAYGFMTADSFNDGEDLWMLATGTGLGPFVSILQREDLWTRFRNLVLVHSVRTADEFACSEQLQALSQRQLFSSSPARLHLLHTATRDASASCMHGRITMLLQNGELEGRVGLTIDPAASRVMLCGNPEMIADTRVLLRERGLLPVRRATGGQFITENYW